MEPPNNNKKQWLDELTVWHQCLGLYDSENDVISPELAEERAKTAKEIEDRWAKRWNSSVSKEV